MHEGISIHGDVNSRFGATADVFVGNLRERDEVGAALAVYFEGELVLDLWGGYADKARTRPWERDTIVCVMSTTKGATALCALQLADQGRLDFDAPVARYWPEFGAAGKDSIPVHMLMSHQAGLAAVREPLPREALFDWQTMTSALARAQPWWEPGTAYGYHAFTFGWLVGEIVRRIDGRSLGTYFRDEIAMPLGLDWLIGFGPEHDSRVAEVVSPPRERTAQRPHLAPLYLKAMSNPPGLFRSLNSRQWRAAEVPAANGHTNARSVARLYAALALGGELEGLRLLSEETLGQAVQERSKGVDLTMGIEMRFGLGFQLNLPPGFGPNLRAFGHAGAGGSLGFADPETGLSVSYTPNQHLAGMGEDPRKAALIRTIYEAL